MKPSQYRKVYAWFTARPAALRALRFFTKMLPLFVGLSYGVLLARLGWGWYTAVQRAADGAAAAAFWQAVLIPAATLALGTVLRRVIDAPRPYDDPAFTPLLEKETKGQALPSRHALSAAVITAVWWRYSVPAGVLMAAVTAAVCATRVLAGVHTVRDVAAGAALGFGMGLALLLR